MYIYILHYLYYMDSYIYCMYNYRESCFHPRLVSSTVGLRRCHQPLPQWLGVCFGVDLSKDHVWDGPKEDIVHVYVCIYIYTYNTLYITYWYTHTYIYIYMYRCVLYVYIYILWRMLFILFQHVWYQNGAGYELRNLETGRTFTAAQKSRHHARPWGDRAHLSATSRTSSFQFQWGLASLPRLDEKTLVLPKVFFRKDCSFWLV